MDYSIVFDWRLWRRAIVACLAVLLGPSLAPRDRFGCELRGMPAATTSPRPRWRVALFAHLTAALAAVLALLLPALPASASTWSAAETRIGAFHPAIAVVVGVHECITAGQRPVRGPLQLQVASGSCVAAEAGDAAVVDATSTVAKVGRRPTAAVRQAADEAATDANGVLRCQACGDAMTPSSGSPNSREFDHIWPFSRGGGRDIDNIWDLCRTCNRQKGANTLEEWGWPW